MKAWGIDLGGTKIECAVFNTCNDMEVVARKRIPTEAFKGYEHILSQIKKLVDAVREEVGEDPFHLGFATPGVLEPNTQVMKNCNTTCMNGKPMKIDLEALLGIPVRIANDANSFALAEALTGAGKSYPNAEVVFGVIMGTGVGGGLVQLNNQQSGIYIIELINLLGQKVYSSIIHHQWRAASKTIEVGTGVGKGIYQLKVSNGLSTSTRQDGFQ